MLLIYRRKNLRFVQRLVSEAEALGVRTFLWALDSVCASVEPWTVGNGPGSRSVLLNNLLAIAAPQPRDFILICDDDVEFVVGGLATLFGMACAGGFMLAQPTHTYDSFYTFRFTCGRCYILARSTRFIEIGPAVFVHPAFRDRVFPMSEHLGMGWAEAIYWYKSIADHQRFGMIDAVRIRHVSPVGLDYDKVKEQAFLDRTLKTEGLSDVREMFCTLDVWYRWQAVPPWACQAHSALGSTA